MAKVKGSLKVIKKNDFGFYSVKIDDTWYGTGQKKAPEGVVTGDTVEGEFELEKGKYKTITQAGLSKAAESAQVATQVAAASSGDKMSKSEWATKDARIQYQHAQNVAVALLGLPGVLDSLLGKAKPADRLGIVEAMFDKYTASAYSDIETFAAVARVNAPAVDPSAPPSEDDDE